MTVDEKIVMKLKSGKQAIQIAQKWEKKGDLIWAERVYSEAPTDYLSASLGKCADARRAKQFLNEHEIVPLLQKVSVLQQRLVAEIDAERVPASVLSGNYPLLVLSHLSCILEEFKLARQFAEGAFQPSVLETSTPFWYDYARGYRCLWEQRPYQKGTFPSLRLAEQYWVPYLDLMAAASKGDSLEGPLAAIDESFRKRNADRRVKDDSYELDGSPYYPVRWDFRRDGLLKLIEHVRSAAV